MKQFYIYSQEVVGTACSQACATRQKKPVKLESRAEKLALEIICNVNDCWFGKFSC